VFVVFVRLMCFFCMYTLMLCKDGARGASDIVLAHARDTQNERAGRSFCMSRARGGTEGSDRRQEGRVKAGSGSGQEAVTACIWEHRVKAVSGGHKIAIACARTRGGTGRRWTRRVGWVEGLNQGRQC
jgi:hypothetical protein